MLGYTVVYQKYCRNFKHLVVKFRLKNKFTVEHFLQENARM